VITLLVTIGPPASGKSTFLEKLHPDVLFCPDNNLYLGNRYYWNDQRVALAWRTEYERFGKMLHLVNTETSSLWAWDATFTTRILRSALVNIAAGFGMRPVALVFKTPLNVCLERNNARSVDRRVPETFIKSAAERLEIPYYNDGFDSSFNVTNDLERESFMSHLQRWKQK
jgi:predicted kinase